MEEIERNKRAKKSHKTPATRPRIITIAHCPHNDHNNEAAGIYSSNIGSGGSEEEPLSQTGYQYECSCHHRTASSIHPHSKNHFSTARDGAMTHTQGKCYFVEEQHIRSFTSLEKWVSVLSEKNVFPKHVWYLIVALTQGCYTSIPAEIHLSSMLRMLLLLLHSLPVHFLVQHIHGNRAITSSFQNFHISQTNFTFNENDLES